jgi:hypothetical protein
VGWFAGWWTESVLGNAWNCWGDEGESVLETFDALLRIGQMEAGARLAGFRALDLAEIARDVADAFRPSAEEQGRAFVMRLDAHLPLQGDGNFSLR